MSSWFRKSPRKSEPVPDDLSPPAAADDERGGDREAGRAAQIAAQEELNHQDALELEIENHKQQVAKFTAERSELKNKVRRAERELEQQGLWNAQAEKELTRLNALKTAASEDNARLSDAVARRKVQLSKQITVGMGKPGQPAAAAAKFACVDVDSDEVNAIFGVLSRMDLSRKILEENQIAISARPVVGTSPGPFSAASGAEVIELDLDDSGDESLPPTPSNAAGTAANSFYDVGVTPEMTRGSVDGRFERATPPRTNRRALLIAISYSGTNRQLDGCLRDQDKMLSLLLREGYSRNEIGLVDDTRGVNPTRKNIIAGIRWLVRGAQPGDTLFLYVTGQGGQLQVQGPGGQTLGYSECIMPVDFLTAKLVLDEEITKVVYDGLPAGASLFSLCDMCLSTHVLCLPYTWDSGENQWGIVREPERSEAGVGTVVSISGLHNTSSPVHTATVTAATTTTGGGATAGSAASRVDSSFAVLTTEEEDGPAVPGAPVRGTLTASFEEAVGSGVGTMEAMFARILESTRSRGFERLPVFTSNKAGDVTQPWDVTQPCFSDT